MKDSDMEWKNSEDPDSKDVLGGSGKVMSTDGAEPSSMPLGMSDFGDDDFMGIDDGNAVGGIKRSNKSGLILMVLVLAVGGGTLWTMRITGAIGSSNPQLAEAEAKIERALERFLGTKNPDPAQAGAALEQLFGDTDRAISVFSDDPTSKQVDVGNVQKNPFEMFVKPPETITATGGTVNDTERQAAERMRQLNTEVSRLVLNSVLVGKEPVAVISDQVVREGQSIGSFTVVSISPKAVELVAGEDRFMLELAEKQDRGGIRR